ncbi:hypothetical protein TNCV_302391 [Trichonephila clavipes]|nr:hypothetical protein TNCV_302391 [Trichonephila clavipes]
MPRAHQFSRRSLAGVGFFESVRSHGPGLALLVNGGGQQQQQEMRGTVITHVGVPAPWGPRIIDTADTTVAKPLAPLLESVKLRLRVQDHNL